MKKQTLAEQYAKQMRRIQKRLDELRKQGYNVVGEFAPTAPKKPSKKDVERLKAVTPAALRRMADKSYNIDIGKNKQLLTKVKKAKSKDFRTVPPSKRPPKMETRKKEKRAETTETTADSQRARISDDDVADLSDMIMKQVNEIINQPYDPASAISPSIWKENQAMVQGAIETAISQDSEEKVIKRLARAPEAAIENIRGFVYSSESNSEHWQSWYSLLDVIMNGEIDDDLNIILSEMDERL